MAGVEHVILCGGAPPPPRVSRDKLLDLRLGEGDDQIRLKIADLTARLVSDLPPALIDLVEIASYVYCADQAFTRGGNGVLNFGAAWRRHLSFHIPVRERGLWSSPEVQAALRNTLGFLSDDEYDFHFSQHKNPAPIQSYLELNPGVDAVSDLDEVLLFSGGLDSLGGAVIEAVRDKRRVALVSHRSNPKISSKQKRLIESLNGHCDSRPFHVPVWVQKGKALDREYTQRSRSFLYAALATVVARAFRLQRIRFYENGVVSMNFPISEQVVGGRATRTTHPQVLNGYAALFSLLTGAPFEVENPFLWKTKGEVVDIIGDHGCASLIGQSVSCSHTIEMTRDHTHCGKCSQCISRRFATLASKYATFDPANIYGVDLLTGEREKNVDITLVESFVRCAADIETKNELQLVELFPEMTRLFNHLKPLKSDDVATGVWRMHKKHASEVNGVLIDGLSQNSGRVLRQELPATCALILAFPDKYKTMPVVSGNEGAAAEQGTRKNSYRFDTPAGTAWPGIVVRFLDVHTVTIGINSRSERRTFAEMNMRDGRNGNPTKQWKLLETLAQNGGCLSWTNSAAHPKLKKQIELLGHCLQEYFNIPESPFHDYQKGSGWRIKLRLEAPR